MLSIKIDFKSFIQKGTPKINDDFLIALITGYQGSGKSYFGVYNIEKNFKNKIIYTNIKSYKANCGEVRYFTKLEEIFTNYEDNCIFLIDELSKKYTKNSPQDLQFYSWLQQSRKHKRYVYLITQEYIQVPTWLRGIANLVYTTHKVKLLPLYMTDLGVPILTEDKEWSISPIKTIIYKRTKEISNLYNTFENINQL